MLWLHLFFTAWNYVIDTLFDVGEYRSVRMMSLLLGNWIQLNGFWSLSFDGSVLMPQRWIWITIMYMFPIPKNKSLLLLSNFHLGKDSNLKYL